MKLQQATWPDIEAYLEHSDALVIPIGSTEQHGPNGLLGTDALCPEFVAAGMAEQGILVAPTLSIGVAQHHLAFPGSITLRPSTMIAVIHDLVRSLAGQGFRRFYFLNGHGGNIATVQAAFAEIWTEYSFSTRPSHLKLELANWFAGPRVKRLSAQLFGDAEGSHATPSEVSLTYYAFPDAARDVTIDPQRAPNGKIRDASDYRNTFPDGRIGSEPGLASAGHGEKFYRAALEDAMESWQAFCES
ncbi:MAG: creatininase family protein [Wenzhouxiangellaceae bacterium]|nr:creatininase family protein [Wenzhouxiangellaceae bacterium]